MVSVDTIEYEDSGTVFEAFVACDREKEGRRPAVLIVHDWMGVGPFVRGRAESLAAMGYLALAADIFGKGIRPGTGEEARELAARYRADRAALRRRARAGLKALTDHGLADPRRTAAIGYCFGGTAVLELARSSAEMRGFVTFHGGLETPSPAREGDIRGKVLVLHGADDPIVPASDVLAFQDEMRQAKVDWQMVFYGGAVHAFTRPDSGNDPSAGVAYDERADRRSWEAMKSFFGEIFS